MLTVDYSRWGQDPEILRGLGLNADHPRTRERFLAWVRLFFYDGGLPKINTL